MLDHISLPVRDFERAAAFYDAVLATLGYRRMKERDGAIGYGGLGAGHPPVFWILQRAESGAASSGVGLHVSFRAKDRAMVQAFHAAALTNGGKDAGQPGERPHYTAGFYGAFAFDPEGFKIEAVVREALPNR
ncbi:MAG TPA: VOC family protein [Rhizomicrobium sp.]|jgi:catechol 2,3-dioxygenase-like lactoylglutathione lyase family enzyme